MRPAAAPPSSRRAGETYEGGLYRTTARGPKCCRGLPEHPRGWSGWLKRKGPRAPPSGQQGPHWAGRPSGPTAWSAAGGSHAVETRTEERGQVYPAALAANVRPGPSQCRGLLGGPEDPGLRRPTSPLPSKDQAPPTPAICRVPSARRLSTGPRGFPGEQGFCLPTRRGPPTHPARQLPASSRALSRGRLTPLLPQPARLPSGTPQQWNREATGALALREGLSPDGMTRLSGAEPRPVHL